MKTMLCMMVIIITMVYYVCDRPGTMTVVAPTAVHHSEVLSDFDPHVLIGQHPNNAARDMHLFTIIQGLLGQDTSDGADTTVYGNFLGNFQWGLPVTAFGNEVVIKGNNVVHPTRSPDGRIYDHNPGDVLPTLPDPNNAAIIVIEGPDLSQVYIGQEIDGIVHHAGTNDVIPTSLQQWMDARTAEQRNR